ncbi:MAG: OmpA family protein [Rhodospirillales bacterium]|nr:OmpA family protein [Rhodospirillales bacterium]
MAIRTRRAAGGADTWAGFVDALSTLLVVLIFALVVFMLAQFFQGIALSGRDEALAQLKSRVAELADMLALERDTNAGMRLELAQLSAALQRSTGTRDDAEQALALLSAERDGLLARLDLLEADLDRALEDVAVTKDTLSLKLAEIASLQRDIDALNAVRENLEAEVGRMILVIEEARATEAALAEAMANRDELEAERLRQRDELERLAILLRSSEEAQARTEAELESARDETSDALSQIDGLLAGIATERDRSMALEAELSTQAERTLLAQREIEDRDIRLTELARAVTMTEDERAAARASADRRLNQIDLLNQQLDALRSQIAALNELLDAAEAQAEADQVQIADLGSRLNAALAARVQELSRYRSEFFEKLLEVLGDRDDVVIVGDRFVLQSELLFASGSAEISDQGRRELDTIAALIAELAADIPSDVGWILRVDGHTDSVPISTARFPTNWELSTARATSVVRYLAAQGVPGNRLAATGFGEFQPIDAGNNGRNRRIEFKLTEQ